MKKLFLATACILSVFFTNSCTNDSELNENSSQISEKSVSAKGLVSKGGILTEDELVKELSTDQDFIDYGTVLLSFFEDMPARQNFRDNYNENDFSTGKENYFLQLSGYTNSDVVNKLNIMNALLSNLYNKYPQLKYDGKNQAFLQEVLEKADAIIESNLQASGKRKPACQACVDKWKPRMYLATIVGGIIGGVTGGWQGAWGGAVIGLAGTGWGAEDCLEAAGC
jgi:hypothetical protein